MARTPFERLDVMCEPKSRRLSADRATPELRAVIRELAERTLQLLEAGAPLPNRIDDFRLSLEIAAIHRLAVVLTKGLLTRDPLSDKVHHGKAAFALTALGGIAATLVRRPFRSRAPRPAPAGAARSRYGAETDVHAEIDPKSGALRLSRHLLVVDQVENDAREITLDQARRRGWDGGDHPSSARGSC